MEEYQFAYVHKRQRILCRRHTRAVGITTNKIHMHNQEELLFITSTGQVRLVSNGNTVTTATPALIINRAGAFHETVEVLDSPMSCFVCFFHPQVFAGLGSQWCCTPEVFGSSDLTVIPLSERQCMELIPLFSLLQQQLESQQRFLLLCIFDQLGQLLAEGLEPIRVNSKLTYIFEVASLLQDMEKGRELTLDQLAERFHVSQTKLKTDFKKIIGIPCIPSAVTPSCRKPRSYWQTPRQNWHRSLTSAPLTTRVILFGPSGRNSASHQACSENSKGKYRDIFKFQFVERSIMLQRSVILNGG